MQSELAEKSDGRSDQELFGQLIDRLLSRVTAAVEAAVARHIGLIPKAVGDIRSNDVAPRAEVPRSDGTIVSASDRLRAMDIRLSILMGKVPEDSGLLLDAKATAKLLNVSVGTLYRLKDLRAAPAPVRIGKSNVRWRLIELLEWIDEGCPPLSQWTYPKERTGRTKRRN